MLVFLALTGFITPAAADGTAKHTVFETGLERIMCMGRYTTDVNDDDCQGGLRHDMVKLPGAEKWLHGFPLGQFGHIEASVMLGETPILITWGFVYEIKDGGTIPMFDAKSFGTTSRPHFSAKEKNPIASLTINPFDEEGDVQWMTVRGSTASDFAGLLVIHENGDHRYYQYEDGRQQFGWVRSIEMLDNMTFSIDLAKTEAPLVFSAHTGSFF